MKTVYKSKIYYRKNKHGDKEIQRFSLSTSSACLPIRFFRFYNIWKILLAMFVLVTCGFQDLFAEKFKGGDNKFFRKNYIILVDQSTPFKNQQNELQTLYRGLTNLFTGKEIPKSINKDMMPRDFDFNPDIDEITVFGFAITGTNSASGGWGTIYRKTHNGNARKGSEFMQDLSDNLIHPRATFSKSCMPVSEFFKSPNVQNLFKNGDFNQDPLAMEFNRISGITLSHYVYPLILNHIKEDSRASEYYIIILTDYKSGASFSDSNDLIRINELAAGKRALVNSFASEVNDLKSPFYTVDWMKMRAEPLYINGMQLGIMSLRGVSVYTNPTIEIEQEYLNRNNFKIAPTEVSFNKNDNIRIDSVYLQFRDRKCQTVVAEHCITRNSKDAEKWFDKERRLFIFPTQTVEFDSDLKNADELEFEYQFFATIIPENGKEIPYVLTTQSLGSKANVIFINDKQRVMIAFFGVLCMLIILLAIMMWRGRLRVLKANVHNFTTRFSLTSAEEGTVELPCWFVGEGQHSTGIRVDGSVDPKYRHFRIPRRDTLEVTVDKVEIPEGLSVCLNDNRDMVAADGRYYSIPLEDGKFKFTLNFWIDTNKFDFGNPSKVKFQLRYKTESSLANITSKIQYHPSNSDDAELIEFFITPEIGISWMGIDPGTSGSCIALGRGGTIRQPNILLVETNQEQIIPSRLIFDKESFERVEDAKAGEDYTYGVVAQRKWRAAAKNNEQSFQSIKKLLGYQNGSNNKIKLRIPKRKEPIFVSGMELAQLLVRGLLKDMDSYINSLPDIVRKQIVPNDEPIKRAVVAIPNNYTLPKTLDMVRSVELSGRFEEVRPIYEAEAILCNYLSKTVGEITSGSRNVIVYDMGGATINLTVFRIDYTHKNGSTYYHIHTLGRIGYAVGGDNIDFALMRYVFSLTDMEETQARSYQEKNKNEILDNILSLKKNLIKAQEETPKEMLSSFDAFQGFVESVTGRGISNAEFLKHKDSEGFSKYLIAQLTESSSPIKNYVKNKIKEVTSEIVNYPDVKKLDKIDHIIFSGRSVLFPNIQRWVLNGLKKKFGELPKWEGLSEQDVKTAVAYGACWYGTFNSLITLDNSRVVSAYGFKLTEDGDTRFVSLVDQNETFNGNDSISVTTSVNSNFASDGNIVEFFQIMGNPESKDIFSSKNRYKVNKLGEISINVATEEISMDVKRCNLVDFSVALETGDRIVRTDVEVTDRDITDENDEAYIFASYTAPIKS